jgi:hypothetical protein
LREGRRLRSVRKVKDVVGVVFAASAVQREAPIDRGADVAFEQVERISLEASARVGQASRVAAGADQAAASVGGGRDVARAFARAAHLARLHVQVTERRGGRCAMPPGRERELDRFGRDILEAEVCGTGERHGQLQPEHALVGVELARERGARQGGRDLSLGPGVVPPARYSLGSMRQRGIGVATIGIGAFMGLGIVMNLERAS